MSKLINDNSHYRHRFSFGISVCFHVLILFILAFNFSWSLNDFDKAPPVILNIDLTQVEVSEKTNLPPEIKKEVKKPVKTPPPVVKEKPKTQPVKQVKKTEPKKIAPKEKPKPKKAAPVKPAPKKQAPKKVTPKPKAKPAPKPAPKPVTKQKPATNTSLKDLLASVDKTKKALPKAKPIEAPKAPPVNKGIKGGTSGSVTNLLSVSQMDLIASKIRQCWNVNAGVKDADKMIIELKTVLNRDGSVQSVDILNMKNDATFKSMAESAKRAIYVCDRKGEESPFKIIANKRGESYNEWKEIYLRMNPVDGGVF